MRYIKITSLHRAPVYELERPIMVKDNCGASWPVESFNIVEYSKSYKSVEIMFRHNNLPYVQKRKKLVFSDGFILVMVNNYPYSIGTYTETEAI